MNKKFYPELTRRLRREGIATGEVKRDALPILVDGREVMMVEPWGNIVLKAGALNDPGVERTYDTVSRLSSEVHEYVEAMSTAPRLQAKGLDEHENFRLLAEFNGVVLAGQELERDWGYKFVTWQRDGSGVAQGNYYHNDYATAKLDFACRAGLVQESRQFTDEQLTEVYRCVHETMDSDCPMTKEREKTLETVIDQIESSVDDLEERVNLSSQRELEAEDQQAGDISIPGLSF